MNDVTDDMKIVDREVKSRTYGGEYVSKLIYESAYRRVTIWFDEYGFELKHDVKEL